MNPLRILLPIILVAVGLPLGILAEECFTNESGSSQNSGNSALTVNSQDDLNSFSDGCTTLIGDILISSTYRGRFVLDGVANVTGQISMGSSNYSKRVTSFELPDAKSIGRVVLHEVPDVQLPKVQRADWVSLRTTSSNSTANLGNLVKAGSVHIQGPWESVDLRSLANVTSSLYLCSKAGCQIKQSDGSPTIDVDLPALESARYISVNGSLSNFSMPQLHTVGVENQTTGHKSGLGLHLYGSDSLQVNLTTLHTLYGRLSVSGEVSWLNISPVANTNAPIYIETGADSEIYSTLENGSTIDVRGNVKLVDLPFIKNVDRINITSNYNPPCTPALHSLFDSKAESKSDIPSFCGGPSKRKPGTTVPNWPDPYRPKHKRRLSGGAIAGIVVGCICGVALLAAGVFWWLKKKKKIGAGAKEGDPTDSSVGDATPPHRE
ncbi:hypothetical protein ASPSYDRAFT_88524 [Aspergillus sydowii CBS 593.65]|uniref:Receptor L-domain domain-containing protein n=1 Tax=Aspergillus sydowii CBS 593.65 TaxID=1036612 RepID=A0A1L9TJQ3_9EURO|nr:uncharacterized protein ASPSYDRAFT_88524 [Aspergillus sydowii CBS 593.65]OJJ59611.1 hypothetical protein ASPSYDRAFT_88524 [Aspergillus sydowii CBS 593.65]